MKKHIFQFNGKLKNSVFPNSKIQMVIKSNIIDAHKELHNTYENITDLQEIFEKDINTSIMSMRSRLILIDVELIGDYKDGADNCFLQYKGKSIPRPSYNKVRNKIKEHFNLNLL